jgi:hypothetical protein
VKTAVEPATSSFQLKCVYIWLMLHSVWTNVVLIALVLQSWAGLTPMGVAQNAQAFAHTLAHAQARNHSHHEDGSLHMEQATDEAGHLHADDGLQHCALLPAETRTATFPRPRVAGAFAGVALTSIYLEGPLRPPRAAA